MHALKHAFGSSTSSKDPDLVRLEGLHSACAGVTQAIEHYSTAVAGLASADAHLVQALQQLYPATGPLTPCLASLVSEDSAWSLGAARGHAEAIKSVLSGPVEGLAGLSTRLNESIAGRDKASKDKEHYVAKVGRLAVEARDNPKLKSKLADNQAKLSSAVNEHSSLNKAVVSGLASLDHDTLAILTPVVMQALRSIADLSDARAAAVRTALGQVPMGPDGRPVLPPRPTTAAAAGGGTTGVTTTTSRPGLLSASADVVDNPAIIAGAVHPGGAVQPGVAAWPDVRSPRANVASWTPQAGPAGSAGVQGPLAVPVSLAMPTTTFGAGPYGAGTVPSGTGFGHTTAALGQAPASFGQPAVDTARILSPPRQARVQTSPPPSVSAAMAALAPQPAPAQQPASEQAAASPVAVDVAAAPTPSVTAVGPYTLLARAEVPYTATDDGDLSFTDGQLLLVLKADPSGWWEARSGDRYGNVPCNYLQLLRLEGMPGPLPKDTGPGGHLEGLPSSGLLPPQGWDGLQVLRPGTSAGGKPGTGGSGVTQTTPAWPQATALYPYDPDDTSEVGLQAGETVMVLGGPGVGSGGSGGSASGAGTAGQTTAADGWSLVFSPSQRRVGYVPSSYIRVVEGQAMVQGSGQQLGQPPAGPMPGQPQQVQQAKGPAVPALAPIAAAGAVLAAGSARGTGRASPAAGPATSATTTTTGRQSPRTISGAGITGAAGVGTAATGASGGATGRVAGPTTTTPRSALSGQGTGGPVLSSSATGQAAVPAPAAGISATAPYQPSAVSAPSASSSVADILASDPSLSSYARLHRMGMSIDQLRAKMRMDGVDEAVIAGLGPAISGGGPASASATTATQGVSVAGHGQQRPVQSTATGPVAAPRPQAAPAASIPAAAARPMGTGMGMGMARPGQAMQAPSPAASMLAAPAAARAPAAMAQAVPPAAVPAIAAAALSAAPRGSMLASIPPAAAPAVIGAVARAATAVPPSVLAAAIPAAVSAAPRASVPGAAIPRPAAIPAAATSAPRANMLASIQSFDKNRALRKTSPGGSDGIGAASGGAASGGAAGGGRAPGAAGPRGGPQVGHRGVASAPALGGGPASGVAGGPGNAMPQPGPAPAARPRPMSMMDEMAARLAARKK